MKKFPKILICGQFFNLRSGGGITLSNLFYGWGKNNIAAIASFIDNPSFDVCERYYQLGSSEFNLRFPFNLKRRRNKIYSGKIERKEGSDSSSSMLIKNKSLLRSIYDKVLFSTGLIHYRSEFKISEDLLRWIKDLSPDIIYSQLSSLEGIRIVYALQRELKVPLAIHIMDDWPNTIGNRYFPRVIWHNIIRREFLCLLSKADALFSISESMSEEYFKRYGLKFIPFHNPISIDNWLPFSKTKWVVEGDFKILYSGRIGIANGKSIIFMANIINEMFLSKQRIKLDIYTPDYHNRDASSLNNLNGVSVKKTVAYQEMPKLLASYDLLLLPLDFDKDGIRFAKLSMPTKTSEYMISGTPILIYSPKETAVAKFFIENNCGYCVTRQSKEEIKEAIRFLISDEEYRQRISRNAVKLAVERFDSTLVRERFRNILRDITIE